MFSEGSHDASLQGFIIFNAWATNPNGIHICFCLIQYLRKKNSGRLVTKSLIQEQAYFVIPHE
jgi:hypothetical protein